MWDFVLAHQPPLEIGQAPIGRRLPERPDLHNLPVGEIVYHLTGETREALLTKLGDLAVFRPGELAAEFGL